MESKSSEITSATVLLGKYELGREIGSGSFAKVHVARSIETGELLAVKIIDKKKNFEAGMETRIIREIEAMRRLHGHPHILKIYEVMATKSNIYLIMELAPGGDLFDKLIDSGSFTEPEARRYFQQLLSALSFCHSEGISHRDVKPQNLLLDKYGNLKVCDFGLSALPENRNSQGLLRTTCGTPAYTAPEVFGFRAYDGAKADVWSCGVVLFGIITGYLPFDDSNVVTMYRKIQRRDYHLPSWISKPVRALIYRMLDPNPATRISIETVMGTTWFRNENSELTSNVFDLNRFLENEARSTNAMTVFDLITFSSGWDLSRIFERKARKERRFTAKVSAEGVMEKAEMIGEKLGFSVEKKGEERVVGLGKGRTVVVMEALELAEGLVFVEVKVVEGVEEEEEEAHWVEIIGDLEEIVLEWHNVGI
ncbi:CBL-interacting serine/threonine-protein kinase 4 [Cardamine amara subsp. amara]|uniref:non-specific serine/threonine protein kinase n=1 Tax=Cardamine amara subsp. amara TaxID=228776 RepID=A0ABD0ZZM0_CARAN